MAEIFISYARSTQAQAEQIAEALRALGYGVWRDDELPAHRAYADVIEERLKSARAVIVLWSADAVKSQWVRAEAEVAREAATLVQLSLDGSIPPLPFNQIQCADMAGWSGDLAHAGWKKVAASVAELAGSSATAPGPPPKQASPAWPPRRRSPTSPRSPSCPTPIRAARSKATISPTAWSTSWWRRWRDSRHCS